MREESKVEMYSSKLALIAVIVGLVALVGWACLVGWATMNYLVP